MSIAIFALVAAAVLVAMNLVSIGLAAWRWRRGRRNLGAPAPRDAPPVTILRPLRGIEAFSEETLASTFALDWPRYEILFLVQRANDPVIPLVRRQMARHPGVPARLLVGDDPISANPKLNNCVKGWLAARHDWIVMADSNVLMPQDYLQRLMEPFDERTGLVVSMPLGTRAEGFFGAVECAILNTFQARWQHAVAALGQGFAQGKNMLWRREVLERAGGIAALAAEPAEDAASTRIVRAQGLEVRLVDLPFEQPLGRRRAKEVWSRHVRWGRLRRATFPWHFLPEILTSAFVPVVLAAWGAKEMGGSGLAEAALTAGVLYGAEFLLARTAGVRFGPQMLPAMIMRDLWLPVLYFDAWLFDDFVWHGQSMTVSEPGEEAAGEAR
jgi:ceramide glucosyltransferase